MKWNVNKWFDECLKRMDDDAFKIFVGWADRRRRDLKEGKIKVGEEKKPTATGKETRRY